MKRALRCMTPSVGCWRIVFSQIAVHAQYGGVVPELASRDHIRKVTPLIQEVFGRSGLKELDGVAYTEGPGLVGALMVGAGGAFSGLGLGYSCAGRASHGGAFACAYVGSQKPGVSFYCASGFRRAHPAAARRWYWPLFVAGRGP